MSARTTRFGGRTKINSDVVTRWESLSNEDLRRHLEIFVNSEVIDSIFNGMQSLDALQRKECLIKLWKAIQTNGCNPHQQDESDNISEELEQIASRVNKVETGLVSYLKTGGTQTKQVYENIMQTITNIEKLHDKLFSRTKEIHQTVAVTQTEINELEQKVDQENVATLASQIEAATVVPNLTVPALEEKEIDIVAGMANDLELTTWKNVHYLFIVKIYGMVVIDFEFYKNHLRPLGMMTQNKEIEKVMKSEYQRIVNLSHSIITETQLPVTIKKIQPNPEYDVLLKKLHPLFLDLHYHNDHIIALLTKLKQTQVEKSALDKIVDGVKSVFPSKQIDNRELVEKVIELKKSLLSAAKKVQENLAVILDNKNLTTRNSELEDENKRLRDAITQMDTEYQLNLSNTNERNNTLNNENQRLQIENDQLHLQHGQSIDGATTLEEENKNLKADVEDLRRQNENLSKQIDSELEKLRKIQERLEKMEKGLKKSELNPVQHQVIPEAPKPRFYTRANNIITYDGLKNFEISVESKHAEIIEPLHRNITSIIDRVNKAMEYIMNNKKEFLALDPDAIYSKYTDYFKNKKITEFNNAKVFLKTFGKSLQWDEKSRITQILDSILLVEEIVTTMLEDSGENVRFIIRTNNRQGDKVLRNIKNGKFYETYMSEETNKDIALGVNGDKKKSIVTTMALVKQGYNMVFIGYGNSGSGKTYSLFGVEGTPGIINECTDALELKLHLEEVMQIYSSDVKNLRPNTEYTGDNSTNIINGLMGQYKEEYKFIPVDEKIKDASDVQAKQKTDEYYPLIFPTTNNSESSRAHTVFKYSTEYDTYGKVYIIDLAGNESPNKMTKDIMYNPEVKGGIDIISNYSEIHNNPSSVDVFNKFYKLSQGWNRNAAMPARNKEPGSAAVALQITGSENIAIAKATRLLAVMLYANTMNKEGSVFTKNLKEYIRSKPVFEEVKLNRVLKCIFEGYMINESLINLKLWFNSYKDEKNKLESLEEEEKFPNYITKNPIYDFKDNKFFPPQHVQSKKGIIEINQITQYNPLTGFGFEYKFVKSDKFRNLFGNKTSLQDFVEEYASPTSDPNTFQGNYNQSIMGHLMQFIESSSVTPTKFFAIYCARNTQEDIEDIIKRVHTDEELKDQRRPITVIPKQ